MFNVPITKSLKQRNSARHCRTPKKASVAFGCCQLDCPQTEIACSSSTVHVS